MEQMNSEDYFFCTKCNVCFPFQSKLTRHLQSESHKMFEDMLLVHSTELSPNSQEGYRSSIEDNEFDDMSDTEETCCISVDDDNYCGSEEKEEDLDDDGSEEEDFNIEELLMDCTSSDGNDYKPFPNKVFFLLYLLVNNPRPIGESNLKFILFLLKQQSIMVPSLTSIKSFSMPGFKPPTKHVTPKGIPFYVNSVKNIVTQCLGSKEVSEKLVRLPTQTNTYKEIYNGNRWMNNQRFYTPMITLTNGKDIFIRDCISFQHPHTGISCGIVVKFFSKGNQIYAVVDVLMDKDQFNQLIHSAQFDIPPCTLVHYETISISASSIIGEIDKPWSILKWNSLDGALECIDLLQYLSPYQLKAKAAGKPVVMVPITLFIDDTSGNKSKKWHEFNSWCLLLAGLGRKENAKASNIHLITSSDSVNVLEMAEPIAAELLSLEVDGITMYDAHLQKFVLVVAPVICLLCDNPMASELLNHLGPTAKRFCRMCMATSENPTEIAEVRSKVTSLEHLSVISNSTTNTERSTLQTRYGLKERKNPLFLLPVDFYRSTPIETLHTILLGPYKYFTKQLMSKLSLQQRQEVHSRIQAFNYSGFKVKIHGNISKYCKSFVGRDYKAWAQMALFIVSPYLNENETEAWISLSKVFQMCYCTYYKPENKENWTAICKQFVQSVKNAYPNMLRKQKIHLILHLVPCMEEFGPTAAYNTERCETFNSLVRNQNIYGNKRAPSRDIAYNFALMDHIRYICGNETCGKDLKEVYQSQNVQAFFNSIPIKDLNQHKAIYATRALRKASKTNNLFKDASLSMNEREMPTTCQNLPDQYLLQTSVPFDEHIKVHHAVIGKQGSLINVGDYVEINIESNVDYGQLVMCCKRSKENPLCFVQMLEKLELFEGQPITNSFECQLLEMTATIKEFNPNTINKAISVVHQCTSSCTFQRKLRKKTVERVEVTTEDIVFEHDYSNKMYCLNSYCMGF